MTFVSTTRTNPDRVEVRDEHDALLATFTINAYTVTLAGPQRTLSEKAGATTITITHSTWVRAAPGPFSGQVDERWLGKALEANAAQVPDALGLAIQYLKGVAPLMLGDLQIAGDASYGPLDEHGKRKENSDFNDYLGLPWLYPAESPDPPEAAEFRCLDCSGYIRMVWGYRHQLPGAGYPDTIPVSLRPQSNSTLPRRSFEQYVGGTGIILVPNTDTQVTDLDSLDIGDLVFFDVESNDGNRLDHVGMYLGTDVSGDHRFISSRKTTDGPTMADQGEPSVINGTTARYARRLRAARRQ